MLFGIGAGTRRSVLLVAVPFFVRLAALLELRRTPFFTELFIDARTYHDMAIQLANGTFERSTPFWQPPFYPYFLSVVYKLLSPQPLIVQIIQAALGGASCLLVYRIGDRLFGNRTARIAWAAAAICSPLIFFDLQLLNVSLALFLMLLALDLLTASFRHSERNGPEKRSTGSAASPPGPGMPIALLLRRIWWSTGREVLSGLALGLASITVATFAVIIPAGGVWLGLRRRSVRKVLPFLIGASIPILVVFGSNLAVSGEPVVISYNAGVNFWIGNNPDYESTVSLRPGRAWSALMDEPVQAGMASPSASSAYFFRKAVRWISGHPGEWLRLMLHKTLLFLRAYEVPRDQEIYPFRSSSLVLKSLLWIHGIGFPFGLLLPLGVAGIVAALSEHRAGGERHDGAAQCVGGARRLDVAMLAVMPALLAAAVIFFFVTARYRLPVLPFLILFAAAGIDWWIRMIGRRKWRAAALSAILVLGLGLTANTGLPKMPAMFNSDAYSDLGTSYLLKGEPEEARRLYEIAHARNPRNTEAIHNLGAIALNEGRLDDAERYFRQVLELYPADPNAMNNLGNVAYRRGDYWGAGELFRRVLEVDPGHSKTRESLQEVEFQIELMKRGSLRRDPERVLSELEARLRQEPGNDFLYAHLVPMLEDQGLYQRALAVVQRRLAHSPDDAEARQAEARLEGIVGGTRSSR